MTPIHKRDARINVSSYHLVSLASIFGKFMGSVVKVHLISHLISNSLSIWICTWQIMCYLFTLIT